MSGERNCGQSIGWNLIWPQKGKQPLHLPQRVGLTLSASTVAKGEMSRRGKSIDTGHSWVAAKG